MPEQLGDPLRVADIRLVAGHRLEVGGIGEQQLEAVLEQVPDRLPVAARGLHRRGRDAAPLQPVGQREEVTGQRAKRADLFDQFTLGAGREDADAESTTSDLFLSRSDSSDRRQLTTSGTASGPAWRPGP